MSRKSQLVVAIAVALSTLVAMGSADAHGIGGRGGGGARIGGGLAQRARQGNAIGNRGASNPGVATIPAPAPAPKPAVVPPVVKPAVAGTTTKSAAPAPTPAPAVVPVSTEAPAPAPEPPAAKSAPPELVTKEAPLPQVPVGATLTLNGKDLTDKVGQVVLQIGDIALPATIKEWKNDAVTCTLPVLGLTKASRATLHVLKADGKTASTMNLELVTSLPNSADASPSSLDSVRFEQ